MSKTQINSSDVKEPFNSTIILGTGINITAMQSGTSNIGSAAFPMGSIFANNIFGTGLGGIFVHQTGDSMTGTLTMGSGANIVASQSGNNLGQPSFPFQNGYINNLVVTNLPASASGVGNIGTAAVPFNVVYANSISGLLGGEFVRVTGDTMTGSLVMDAGSNAYLKTSKVQVDVSGNNMFIGEGAANITLTHNAGVTSPYIQLDNSDLININSYAGIYIEGPINISGNITPYFSGTSNLGTAFLPFNNIFANNLIGPVASKFVHTSGDAMTGSLRLTPGNALIMNNINIGSGTIVTGTDSIIIGVNTTLIGSDSTSVGLFNNVNGNVSTAIGLQNVIVGDAILTAGYSAKGYAQQATSVGYSNTASGSASTAVGNFNTATGTQSTAVGYFNQTFGSEAIGIGANNFASGDFSTAVGQNNNAAALGTTVFGYAVTGTLSQIMYIGAPSGVMIQGGKNLLPEFSGTQNLGSPSNPYSTIYANQVVGTSPSGAFVHISGDRMTGPLYNDVISANLNPWIYISGSVTQGFSNFASGSYSHAEGVNTSSAGFGSHAEGGVTVASGNNSHAEGASTKAVGLAAHAEGNSTIAWAGSSHAEGLSTQSYGNFSHAEGNGTVASGNASHAAGNATIASADYSHAEGDTTIAGQYASHAEGILTQTNNAGAHAEGYITQANGYASHAEGNTTSAWNDGAHAEGFTTVASGNHAHAEGEFSIAYGEASHAEGYQTIAYNLATHAEGENTQAFAQYSHSEGYFTVASGTYSHAGGYFSVTQGEAAHAEGSGTMAVGAVSHSEGGVSRALGDYSHAQGFNTTASGLYSFAAGRNAGAYGYGSVAIATSGSAIASGSWVLTDATSNVSANNVANSLLMRFSGGVTLDSGTSLNFIGSGNQNIGTVSSPANNIFSNQFIAPVQTLTGLTYTVKSTDNVLLVNSTGTATIGLPIFASGFNVVFKDKSGAANLTTRKIAITGISCNLDGSAEFDINSNYGRLRFISDGTNWFRIE